VWSIIRRDSGPRSTRSTRNRSPGRSRTRPNPSPPTPTLSPLPPTDVPASVAISTLALSARRTTGTGRVVRLALAGARSGVTRQGYVYLPPQYFQPAFASTSFPVIELLHGDPGDPTGWIYGLHVPEVMDREIASGKIGPMVVVMPSTFGGKHGQDCVDAPGGAHDFRVLPPGPHWAIGGLSDGGFCAANLALRHPGSYGAVASLDGFYSAYSDLAVMHKIFGVDAAGIRANDPSTQVADVRHSLPRFWIMSGTANSVDMKAAQFFREIVTAREPIAYVVVHNGKHTPPAWRAVMPSLLEWSWNTISGGAVGIGTTQFGIPAQPPSSPPAPKSTPTHPSSPPSTSSGPAPSHR
jgi:enterochelin esterase-like enzyme